MRIIVTADIHNGYPGRIDDTIWSMRAMSQYANEHGIEKILVLGDFYHNRNHVALDVLNKVTDFLDHDKKDHEWILFPGNHDMFLKTSWDLNSVRPLQTHATVINTTSYIELDGRRFVIVPFIHYESSYMDIIRQIEEKHGEDEVLLTHIGVNNAINNSCFLLKHWSIVSFLESKFPLILSGHFHCHQVIDDKLCYPGSPIPFRFDEGVVPHGFLDVDTDELMVNFIDLRDIRDDCPPDFVTINDDRVNEASDSIYNGNKIRVALSREYSTAELNDIRGKILERGALTVHWMKFKDNEVSTTEQETAIQDKSGVHIFDQWLEHKQPNGYDHGLLSQLNAQIAEEAEEEYALAVGGEEE